jgi:FlaA1/EpsC-like NDP-sugar epimerase
VLNTIVSKILLLPRAIKQSIVLLADTAACIFSIYFAFYLRLGEWLDPLAPGYWRLYLVIQVALALFLPLFIGFGLYREIFRYSSRRITAALLRASVVYSFIFIFIFAVIGFDGVPRTIAFIQPLVFILLVSGMKGIAGHYLRRPLRNYLKIATLPRVLIYGAGEAGRQLENSLSQSYDMRVEGFLDDDPELQGNYLAGKRIYSPADIEDVSASLNIDSILLAIPSASRARRNQIIEAVQGARLPIKTLPSIGDLALGKVLASDLRALDIEDLLGREPISPDPHLLRQNSHNKIVMVSGAGGSIGSELCRQIADQEPTVIILVDQNEFALYKIQLELEQRASKFKSSSITLVPLLVSIANIELMRLTIERWRPSIIYHAAAYKHVPLVESNAIEGIRNNVMGTLALAKLAIESNVPNFVLISTDKAVRPTNVMGASKRLAEMVLQALAETTNVTKFSMVRFGNVLNSSGSVVPRFQQQIESGGPITITDKSITRYFMTIPEASQLVIQAGSMATGGDVFLLDMGEPVKILDLARRMIELSGLEIRDANNPAGDIEITEIGLRPGEKLYEELLIDGAPEPTSHPRIFKSHEEFIPWSDLSIKIDNINSLLLTGDLGLVLSALKDLVPGYASLSQAKISLSIKD